MKKMKIKLILIIACSIITSVSLSAQDTNLISLKAKIDSTNKIIDEAALKQDFETIAAYYTDDVITLPNNEPLIQGKKAFIDNEKIAAKRGIKILSIKSTLIDLFASGDLIHEIGKYEISLEIPGVPYPITDKGKYLVIWQQQNDGTLKIKLETWNNDEEHR
jgi:ketosteroid isomerase-like protein